MADTVDQVYDKVKKKLGELSGYVKDRVILTLIVMYWVQTEPPSRKYGDVGEGESLDSFKDAMTRIGKLLEPVNAKAKVKIIKSLSVWYGVGIVLPPAKAISLSDDIIEGEVEEELTNPPAAASDDADKSTASDDPPKDEDDSTNEESDEPSEDDEVASESDLDSELDVDTESDPFDGMTAEPSVKEDDPFAV